MIFGQDRDQLLRGAVPQIARRRILRAALSPGRRWRVIYAVVDVEAVVASTPAAAISGFGFERFGRCLRNPLRLNESSLAQTFRQVFELARFMRFPRERQ